MQGTTADDELNVTAYQNIKDHFLLRFQQIDNEIISQTQDIALGKQMIHNYQKAKETYLVRQTLVDFIQEGIGALLAYLPKHVAVQTLNDFLSVLNDPISLQETDNSPRELTDK